MPNHFHGILQIVTPFPEKTLTDVPVRAGFARPDDTMDDEHKQGAGRPRPYVPTLGNMMAYFKYQTTQQINLSTKLWQRNYYEHIIRNDKSYQTISEYIIHNPANWEADKLYGSFVE